MDEYKLFLQSFLVDFFPLLFLAVSRITVHYGVNQVTTQNFLLLFGGFAE
jgi:positive regulator of sigma E activity